MSYAVSFIV